MTTRKPPKPSKPRLDLEDVLSRARAMDPDAVDPNWSGDSVEFDDSDDDLPPLDPGADGALAEFLVGARRHLDEAVARRSLLDIPPAPVPAKRRWLWWGVGAAAAALLVAGTAQWITRGGSSSAVAVPEQAAYVATGASLGRLAPVAPDTTGWTDSGAEPDGQEDSEEDPDARAPADDAGDADAAEDAGDEADPSEADTTSDDAEAKPAKKARPRKSKAADAASLSELDARAQQAWARGDLERAAELFELIIKRSPRSRSAELAYADLFSIAEQGKDQRGLQRLWKSYLERFPMGRYSDDTRARLCRRASGDAAVECWSDYLRRHPQGAHAREARAAVDGKDAP